MKCPPFDYHRATSVPDAVDALQAAGDEGKILAGGQSLVPVLALRLARPAVLVDVNRVPDLAGLDLGCQRRLQPQRLVVAAGGGGCGDGRPLLAKHQCGKLRINDGRPALLGRREHIL